MAQPYARASTYFDILAASGGETILSHATVAPLWPNDRSPPVLTRAGAPSSRGQITNVQAVFDDVLPSALGKRSREEDSVPAPRRTAAPTVVTAGPAAPLPPPESPYAAASAAAASPSQQYYFPKRAPSSAAPMFFRLSTMTGHVIHARMSNDMALMSSTFGRAAKELKQLLTSHGKVEVKAGGLVWLLASHDPRPQHAAATGSISDAPSTKVVEEDRSPRHAGVAYFSVRLALAATEHVLYERRKMTLPAVADMIQSEAVWSVTTLRQWFDEHPGYALMIRFGLIDFIVFDAPIPNDSSTAPTSSVEAVTPAVSLPAPPPPRPAPVVPDPTPDTVCHYRIDAVGVRDASCLLVSSCPSVKIMAFTLGIEESKLKKRLTATAPFMMTCGDLRYTVMLQEPERRPAMMPQEKRHLAGGPFQYTLLVLGTVLYSRGYEKLSQVAATIGWTSKQLTEELIGLKGRMFVTYGELMHTVVADATAMQQVCSNVKGRDAWAALLLPAMSVADAAVAAPVSDSSGTAVSAAANDSDVMAAAAGAAPPVCVVDAPAEPPPVTPFLGWAQLIADDDVFATNCV